MLCSWFFMPPGANEIKGAKFYSPDPSSELSPSAESMRRFLDARMCLAFYLTAAMAWFATRIGLLRFGGPQYVCLSCCSSCWQSVRARPSPPRARNRLCFAGCITTLCALAPLRGAGLLA